MKPHGTYDTAFQAGAASRDAEVANLAALGSSYLNRANAAEQEIMGLNSQVERLQAILARRLIGLCKCKEERSQLRNLLRPFAALLQDHNCNGPDAQPIFQINDAVITLGDLRRAVAATEQQSPLDNPVKR